MSWHDFFHDLEKWMEASNIMAQKYGIESDRYWHWLVETLSIIEARYEHQPLVSNILAEILDYQTGNWQKTKKQKEEISNGEKN